MLKQEGKAYGTAEENRGGDGPAGRHFVGQQQQQCGIPDGGPAFHLVGHPVLADGLYRDFLPGDFPVPEAGPAGTPETGREMDDEIHPSGAVSDAGDLFQGHLLQQCGDGHGAPVHHARHPAADVSGKRLAAAHPPGSGGGDAASTMSNLGL